MSVIPFLDAVFTTALPRRNLRVVAMIRQSAPKAKRSAAVVAGRLPAGARPLALLAGRPRLRPGGCGLLRQLRIAGRRRRLTSGTIHKLHWNPKTSNIFLEIGAYSKCPPRPWGERWSRRPAWSGRLLTHARMLLPNRPPRRKICQTTTMRCRQDAEEFAAAACFAISLVRSAA
jgi:hypothetical protein